MGSAAIASAVLGSIMIVVILLSHHLRINPDNVATPIAASLGDLVTLGLLSVIARGLFVISSEQLLEWLCVCGVVARETWLLGSTSLTAGFTVRWQFKGFHSCLDAE